MACLLHLITLDRAAQQPIVIMGELLRQLGARAAPIGNVSERPEQEIRHRFAGDMGCRLHGWSSLGRPNNRQAGIDAGIRVLIVLLTCQSVNTSLPCAVCAEPAAMLKGLSPLLSPDLLHVLASMGHGDEIVLADANFPAATHARRLVQLSGADAPQVLDAVLCVLPLDDFVEQAAHTMQVVAEPSCVPEVVQAFNATLQRHGCKPSSALERFAFYQRAAAAFAIVATGERRGYGNILLKKGVVRP